ncbi:MAG: hypothetical protein IJD70_03000 [Clostridia bacterium]|nr:hypothetical protein [Clostridia bacterium]
MLNEADLLIFVYALRRYYLFYFLIISLRNVGILGHDGMKATDRTIMEIMLKRPMC